jgi:hypothetical protein
LCKGIHKIVGKTKYFKHKKYHDPNSQFTEQLWNFFNANPIIYEASPNILGGSGSFSGVIVPTADISGPVTQAEQMHGPVDNSYCKDSSVCIFDIDMVGKTNV